MARSGGASTPLPLRRRLTGPGHPPQPMSASRGGPWTQSLRLLRLLASAVGNQNRVATAQVDPAPHRFRAAHRTVPRGTEGSCSPARRPGPARHRHRRLRSTHGEQETLKEFGVSGAGKSRVRKGGCLCLGNVFFFDRVGAAPGRGQGGVSAESGPSYTIRTHTAHVHGAASPSLPCLFVRLF